jgi:hypothetical protein
MASADLRIRFPDFKRKAPDEIIADKKPELSGKVPGNVHEKFPDRSQSFFKIFRTVPYFFVKNNFPEKIPDKTIPPLPIAGKNRNILGSSGNTKGFYSFSQVISDG